MGLDIGSIVAKVSLDASGYVRGAKEVEETNKELEGGWKRYVTNPAVLAAGAITAVGGAAAVYAVRALHLATSNERFAQRTQLSIETVQALRAEFNRTGREVNILIPAMAALFAAIEAGHDRASDAGKLFSRLGIDVRSIEGGDDALRKTIDALNAISDPIERAAVAAKLFGGGAGTLITSALRSSEAIDGMIARGTELGLVLDGKTVSSLARLNTSVATIKQAVDGFGLATTAEFLAGFESSAGDIEESIQRMASSLRSGISPLIRELGAGTGDIAKNIDEWTLLLTDFVEGLRVVQEILGPLADAAVWTRNLLGDFFARVITNGESIENLRTVPDDIRRQQIARGIPVGGASR